jgi:choline dehydrogenase-like flavoprotein
VPKGSSGVTLNSYTLRPKSRGSVTLRSADPKDKPIVDPNFLAEPDDLRCSVEGVKISREIFSAPSLQKYIKAIRFPDEKVRTQADFEAYARQYGRTSYHPVSTCRMGKDEMAVVDPALRVRGIDGLRICDSSIMPSLIGSNTNAPSIMIGERAADLIRGNR